MIINPIEKKKIVSTSFPQFIIVSVYNLLVNFNIWDTHSLITCMMML